MKNIQNIYKMLHWKNSPETRLKGILLAKKEKNLSLLIMPQAHPSVWEACAKILSDKSDEDLEPYLLELFDWLNDVNWPGGHIIFNRLLKFSGAKLQGPFVQCVKQILQRRDEDDDRWLYNLSELLTNRELQRRLPNELVESLLNHKNAWLSDG